MRVISAAIAMLAAGATIDGAAADPYRWCVEYSGRGATNCYFITLAQCQATASGNGGFCRPNGFYDGQPLITPGEAVRRSRERS
jgi:Protein of unknown function (DUF3551)